MEPITSGTTIERIVRSALLALLVDAFAVAYLWDGYVGYARENGEELARLLGVSANAVSPAYRELTPARGRIIAELVAGGAMLSTVAPALREPTIRHGGDDYYLGPAGWLQLGRDGTRITSAAWNDGKRKESDQLWQRRIGYLLALFGVVVTIHLGRVLATRMTLSDDGLWVRGTPLIPWEAITDLRADPSGRSGRAELAYSFSGRTKVLRLDEYVYKSLPAILGAIRERKGFSNKPRSEA